MSEQKFPNRADLELAHERLRPVAHRTPVFTSSYLNECTGAELFFKCENFQKVGAFKFRGAMNAVASLREDEISRGVVTHSSGNHAQALALAARLRGAKAHIVMPRTAPKVKIDAVRGYGARVIFCEPMLSERESGVDRVIEETGALLIHPFDDPRIIAGQGTAAKELIEEIEEIDMILAPVGGGGLLSGTALAATHFSPDTRVYGTEPSAADDALRSFKTGRLHPSIAPKTIADGLLTSLSELTLAVIRRHVEDIYTVEEEEIVAAMRLVWERMKIIIEPSCAVPVAALQSGRIHVKGRRVGVILSGGNVDLDNLPWLGDKGGKK